MLSHPTILQQHHDHHHRVELSWKLRGCQIVTIAITWSSLTFGLLCLNRAYFVMKADSCRKSFLFSFAAESFQKYLGLEAQTGVDQWLWDWAATLFLFLPVWNKTDELTARASRVIWWTMQCNAMQYNAMVVGEDDIAFTFHFRSLICLPGLNCNIKAVFAHVLHTNIVKNSFNLGHEKL